MGTQYHQSVITVQSRVLLSSHYRSYIWDKGASLCCHICESEDENLDSDQKENVLSDICSNFWIVSNVKKVQQGDYFLEKKIIVNYQNEG